MENAKMRLLKELKAENIVPPESLDEVSAGSCYEMADDSRFLNVLLQGEPYQPDRYGATKCWINKKNNISLELSRAWASVGIDFMARDSRDDQNSYILQETGQVLTQKQAWAHAEYIMERHLEEKDWNW